MGGGQPYINIYIRAQKSDKPLFFGIEVEVIKQICLLLDDTIIAKSQKKGIKGEGYNK